jgi:hypothetical protein
VVGAARRQSQRSQRQNRTPSRQGSSSHGHQVPQFCVQSRK